MTKARLFTEDSASVQSHTSIMQGVINRMAHNSASCKAWSVALASAIVVVTFESSVAGASWLALIPVALFASLDIYYLALEKAFRESYRDFVERVHTGNLQPDDLYEVKPAGAMPAHLWAAGQSYSVWGLYGGLAVVVAVVAIVVG